MSGSGASVRASAARRLSPPERLRGVFVAGEAELLEQQPRPVRIVAGREPGLDEGRRRREAGEVGLLRQVADGRARLQEAAAGVGLDQPGGDLQERRLAGAVPADQAQALAGADRQLGAGQQRRAAKGEADVLKEEKRGCHRCRQPFSGMPRG